ncbi:MAG: zinc-binding dehydrogenase [Bacillota bacterium]|nr:zinc-binding dehydrogenase [Bacillota bacterium]
MTGPHEHLVLQELPMPRVEPGGVLLRTIASEVCGTDVHIWHGRLSGVPYPIIPGHVSVGEVVETGGHVVDVDGRPVAPGEVVTFLDVHETCGLCWYCLVAKASTRCPHRKVYGITYGVADGLLGGWSEHIYLKPGVKIVHLPDNVSPERFIGGGCGLPTAFHAVERGGVGLGDTVAVQGSGPVGLNAVILSQLAGAVKVILIGSPAIRLAMGRALGADATLDIADTTPELRRAAVLDMTGGRGADVTIEVTGNPAAVTEGMRLTRDAGVLAVAGQYTDAGETCYNPHQDLNRRHIEVRATWGTDFSHLYRGIQVVAKHGDRFRWERFITRRYGLGGAEQALTEVASGKVIKAVIDPRFGLGTG